MTLFLLKKEIVFRLEAQLRPACGLPTDTFKLIRDTEVKRVGTCTVVAGEVDATRL